MIYFFMALATLWSAFCFLAPLYGFINLWMENDKALSLLLLCIVWPLCIILAFIPWQFYIQEKSPDLVTLKKNEWFCSQQHSEVTTSMIMTGKVMVPVTTTHEVCDQYNRR